MNEFIFRTDLLVYTIYYVRIIVKYILLGSENKKPQHVLNFYEHMIKS